MKVFGISLLTAFIALGCSARHSPPEFIDILTLDDSIVVNIRYATANNFTGKVLYPVNRCLLRPKVARRLVQVQSALRSTGKTLKIWDCYRPLDIQRKLWEIVPDPRYVADPAKGSRHNRGAAVDLTLIDETGQNVEMPTDYDDFSKKAHRNYAGASPAAKWNRSLLEAAMKKEGFSGLRTEWWHFDAEGWAAFPIANTSLQP
jgi:D-alanyl-D-alanine dipeptidase